MFHSVNFNGPSLQVVEVINAQTKNKFFSNEEKRWNFLQKGQFFADIWYLKLEKNILALSFFFSLKKGRAEKSMIT